jgi:hypothetical protein
MNVILKHMNKIKEIFKSWNIALNPDETQAELASKRIEICNSCEFKVENLGFNQCSVCGCALKAKVFTPIKGACPKGKWDEIDNVMINQKIFVQLASYRDPQLVPTIRDMLLKADNPQNLQFGICWQKDDTESLEEFTDHPQVRYQTYNYTESEGLGWARAKVAELWDGEPYTLQLDSHHRFAKGWDTMMIEDYVQALTMSRKPIISTYLTPFEVKNHNQTGDEGLNPTPCLMSQYEFSADKLLMSMPWYIQDYKNITSVIRARTLSGHFYFTKSDFIQEVPYDPDIYFGGYCEETTMSVRAFTHGYDFFSPYRQYIWHEYTRADRPKHWDDHGKESQTKKTSGERDTFARKKTRQLFDIEDNDINIEPKYDLGNVRSLHDYEVFGGFDFKKQRIQPYTLKVNTPPNPYPWEDQFEKGEDVNVVVEWDVEHFKSQSEELMQFITLGILSKNNQEIYRHDFTPERDRDVIGYQINSHTAKVNSLEVKDGTLLMYGMKQNGEWTTPFNKKL